MPCVRGHRHVHPSAHLSVPVELQKTAGQGRVRLVRAGEDEIASRIDGNAVRGGREIGKLRKGAWAAASLVPHSSSYTASL